MDSLSKTTNPKSIRPVLIASENTAEDYSLFLEHLLTGLADESIPTTLVCPPSCDMDSVASPTAKVIRYPFYNLPFLWHQNKKRLIEEIDKFKPTVLHCLCETNARLTRRIARHLDLPYILSVNSLQKRSSRLSISSKRLTKIIVPTQSIAANMAEIYPQFEDRIEQINIGTFVKETNHCFCEPNQLASMVSIGLSSDKGSLENLLGAIRHLVIGGYEFILAIIDDGQPEKEIRKLLLEMGISQNVIIVPKLKPWHSVLAAGDVFILPIASNAFNPLLLEAMSAGVAVAACKGGVDDLIIENQTAVVFDNKDELSIVACLQRLLDARDFSRKLASQAQNYLRENHTVSNMITSLLQNYSNPKT